MRISTKAGPPLVGLLAVLVIALVAWRSAPSTTTVSGVFTLHYVAQSLTGVDSKGASVFVSTGQGRNRNTGDGDYLANARLLAVDTAAMIEGNGTHSGTVTASEGGDTLVERFTGATTTKMLNGKPQSTFKGLWTIVRGTGRYAGITGNGTYIGRFETEKRYVVQWKGDTSE